MTIEDTQFFKVYRPAEGSLLYQALELTVAAEARLTELEELRQQREAELVDARGRAGASIHRDPREIAEARALTAVLHDVLGAINHQAEAAKRTASENSALLGEFESHVRNERRAIEETLARLENVRDMEGEHYQRLASSARGRASSLNSYCRQQIGRPLVEVDAETIELPPAEPPKPTTLIGRLKVAFN